MLENFRNFESHCLATVRAATHNVSLSSNIICQKHKWQIRHDSEAVQEQANWLINTCALKAPPIHTVLW